MSMRVMVRFVFFTHDVHRNVSKRMTRYYVIHPLLEPLTPAKLSQALMSSFHLESGKYIEHPTWMDPVKKPIRDENK